VDKTIPNDPVAGLIDIPLPVAISLWPTTWASWIAIVLIVVGLTATIWWFTRRWHANRYRRAALAELDLIMQAPRPNAGALELLLRRTALAEFPRETIAPLSGTAWLSFLDKTYGGQEFSRGPGRAFALAPYAPAPDGDIASLAELVRRWIRTHHA
jgi:Ca-activated chloride channel family protein